jgi:hypothetical protein
VIAVLAVAVGAGLGQVLIGLVVAVALGACTWAAVWFGAPHLLLGRLGGRFVEEEDVPRAANLVDGLCGTMGLPLPGMMLVDDPFRGALAIGRNERTATLVLTTGLLRALHPVELEGVLAHELSHIKSGDMASATMAAAVVLPVAPLFAGSPELVRKLAGAGRELAADERAYSVTRFPPGLRHRARPQVGVDGRPGASCSELGSRRPRRPGHPGRSPRRGVSHREEPLRGSEVDSGACSKPPRILSTAGGQARSRSSEGSRTCFAAG